jgi:tripartite-type tricarboxylate transporter receptor subunit TctC
MRRYGVRSILAALAALWLSSALAQDFPNRPIRIVVPYGSGSNGEAGLRVLTSLMEPRLGQRLLVETRPGGGGNVGAASVAGSSADGYTLLLGATNNFTINQYLYKMDFDPVTAFEPITIVFDIPFIMYSSTVVPARTLEEFVGYARSHPEQLNYASSGAGTPPHLAGEMLSHLANIRMVHVPYKSNAQSVAALLAGEVHLFVGLISGAQAHVDAGKLRILATAVPQRLSRIPQVPSAREAGFPTFNISTWWALAAPHGTPRAVVDKLYEAVRTTLRDTDLKERYAQLGMVPIVNRPAEFAAQIAKEADSWGTFIRARNIHVD